MSLHSINLFCLTTLALISLHYCQYIGIGLCPTPEVKKDFDIKKFGGKWYQFERYQGDYLTSRTVKCNIVYHTAVDNMTVEIHNTYISTAQVGNKSVQSTYRPLRKAHVVDEKKPAKMVVQNQIDPDESYYGYDSNLMMHYWILDTLYDSHALVWTCTSDGFFNTQYAEILARTDSLSKEVIDKIHRGLYRYNLRPEYFRPVKQTDCDY